MAVLIELVEIVVGLVSFVVAVKAFVTIILLALFFVICFPFALFNDSKLKMNKSIEDSRKMLLTMEREYNVECMREFNKKLH
jgi:Ca2+-dependent lipid-binding protein